MSHLSWQAMLIIAGLTSVFICALVTVAATIRGWREQSRYVDKRGRDWK